MWCIPYMPKINMLRLNASLTITRKYTVSFSAAHVKKHRRIADKLMQEGYNADSLHGELSQVQRDTVMQKFRIRNIQILVATDVAARGLDVDDLTSRN